MYEVSLNDVLGNIEHELRIVSVAKVKNTGEPYKVLAMGLHPHVSRMIGLVVADFVNGTIHVFIDLLLRDMPFHFRDTDSFRVVCDSHLLKVFPQITVG